MPSGERRDASSPNASHGCGGTRPPGGVRARIAARGGARDGGVVPYLGRLHRVRVVPAVVGICAPTSSRSAATTAGPTSWSSTGPTATGGTTPTSSRRGCATGRGGDRAASIGTPPRWGWRRGDHVARSAGALGECVARGPSVVLVAAHPRPAGGARTVVVHELAHLRVFGHGPDSGRSSRPPARPCDLAALAPRPFGRDPRGARRRRRHAGAGLVRQAERPVQDETTAEPVQRNGGTSSSSCAAVRHRRPEQRRRNPGPPSSGRPGGCCGSAQAGGGRRSDDQAEHLWEQHERRAPALALDGQRLEPSGARRLDPGRLDRPGDAGCRAPSRAARAVDSPGLDLVGRDVGQETLDRSRPRAGPDPGRHQEHSTASGAGGDAHGWV